MLSVFLFDQFVLLDGIDSLCKAGLLTGYVVLLLDMTCCSLIKYRIRIIVCLNSSFLIVSFYCSEHSFDRCLDCCSFTYIRCPSFLISQGALFLRLNVCHANTSIHCVTKAL